jgi:hypothetical protein
MKKLLWSFLACTFTVVELSAGAALEHATVNRIVNEVNVLHPGRIPVRAKLQDLIKDDLGVRTGSASRAELLFQDATLTRLGANTVFSFKGGTRDLSLPEGTMLLQVPKGRGGARIRTAGVSAAITGTTIIIEHLPARSLKVAVLEGSLRLSIVGRLGETMSLTAGKMVVMKPDARSIPNPVDFDLRTLMKTSALAGGVSFSGDGKATPLPSLALIEAEITRQDRAKGRGRLAATNLAIFGTGTKVSVTDDEAITPPPSRDTQPGTAPLERLEEYTQARLESGVIPRASAVDVLTNGSATPEIRRSPTGQNGPGTPIAPRPVSRDLGPDDGGTLPDSGGALPDSGSTLPDSGSILPDTGSTLPDTGSTLPDTGSTLPDTGSTLPETGSTLPDTGSILPDTGSTLPDTGSTLPDTGSTLPDTGSTLPDTGSTLPDTGSTLPDTGSILPDTGSILPDTGSILPDTGSILPGTGSILPDTGSILPDTGSILPDTGSILPDTGSILPDTGSILPDTGSILPDTGSILPDTGSILPDTGSILPDTGSTLPDTGSILPDTGSTLPDTGSTLPDTGSILPETGSILTDTGSILPDTGSILPDTGSTLPDTGSTLPDIGSTLPDIGSTLPDTGSILPDTGSILPDTGSILPDTGSTLPDTGSILLDTGSILPDTGSTLPDIGSTLPDTGSTLPDTGSILPDTGSILPDTGSILPDTGSILPDTGSILPDTGSILPDTGSILPDTGSVLPDTGSILPDTGSTLPDTGSTLPDPGSTIPDVGDIAPATFTISPAPGAEILGISSLPSGQMLNRKGADGLLVIAPTRGGIAELRGTSALFNGTAINGANFNGGNAVLGIVQEGGSGGRLDIGTSLNPIAGQIVVEAPISATTGSNSLTAFGGNGGTVNMVADGKVTVKSAIKVSDSVSGRASKSGGTVSIESRAAGAAIVIENSAQLLSLLDAAAPGPGGIVRLQAPNGTIEVKDSTIRADKGQVEIRTGGGGGAPGHILLQNATLRGDVVKVGAFGTDSRLTITGGSIHADTLLKLYASGSNGTVYFGSDITLSGAGAKHIAGKTVEISSGKTVTIGGNNPASVYTDNPKYTGSGGNGNGGQFGGAGAQTKPFNDSSRPGF